MKEFVHIYIHEISYRNLILKQSGISKKKNKNKNCIAKKRKKNQWGWSMSSYQKRRISVQTYKFPKWIFFFFFFSSFSIHFFFFFSSQYMSFRFLRFFFLFFLLFNVSPHTPQLIPHPSSTSSFFTVLEIERSRSRRREEKKWRNYTQNNIGERQ